MPQIFISHSSKDDLAAEALRGHLVTLGWPRSDVFLDHSIEGIAAHQRWKEALAQANSAANALVCLASPDWLDSKESQVERRVAETLASIDRHRTRAVLIAILRDLRRDDLQNAGLGECQTVNLGADGGKLIVRAELPAKLGEAYGRQNDVPFNTDELAKLVRSLREIGAAPDAFPWTPRDTARPSPYPGLEAFRESEAGVFFGRDARIAEAVAAIEYYSSTPDAPRLFTILAASGVGKSSFLRAGLWPRLKQRANLVPLTIVRPSGGIVSGRENGFIYTLADWFRANGQSVDAAVVRQWMGTPVTAEGVARVLAHIPGHGSTGRTLLIGIDQGEELFASLAPGEVDEAHAFLGSLFALQAAPPSGIDLMTVLTIRADSYDPLAANLKNALDRATAVHAPRVAALREASLTLEPMSDTAFREVITRPARVARKSETDFFAPSLVDHLIATFKGGDALPLLAMTLEQLFDDHRTRDRITLDAYRTRYGETDGPEGPVREALKQAYRIAGPLAGTDTSLRRLLIPALATWDPVAGETGAAKRRIAAEGDVVGEDAALEALADALVDPRVRLLVRGGGRDGATLEIAHEALLRIAPVSNWISEAAADLRLRDDVQQEAQEWSDAYAARAEAATTDAGENELKQADARIDKAVAARRGPRLEEVQALIAKPEFRALANEPVVDRYLTACSTKETAERDKQRRLIGRAFVKPALAALQDGLSEHALRLAAAGALLADDIGLQLVPELWSPVARAITSSRTDRVLKGHEGAVTVTAFSPDGKRVVTGSDDNAAKIIDVARFEAVTRGRALVLAAALARAIGWRTDVEAADLLMQDAPEDLFDEALRQLGRNADDPELQEAISALHAPLHPNCYLSPTQFAEKFGLEMPGAAAAFEEVVEAEDVLTDETAAEDEEPDEGTEAGLTSKAAIPRVPVTADDLAGQEFVETHAGIPIFRLADGRYHVISNFAVATLDDARASAEELGGTIGSS